MTERKEEVSWRDDRKRKRKRVGDMIEGERGREKEEESWRYDRRRKR